MAGVNSLNPLIQEQEAVGGYEINLKVTLNEASGQTRVLKFDHATYVNDALKVCAEQAKVTDYADYGLYYFVADISKCRWLARDKTLRYYDIHNHDQLIFKKKQRPLAITLTDGSKKKAMIDDSDLMESLVVKLCAKFNIANPEEYSLKKPDSAEGDWLDPNRTLHEQGILPEDELMLKKKFFYHDANVDTNDPTTLNLLYEQIREDIVTGKLPVSEKDAIDFAALQCQVVLGVHNPSKHTPSNIKVAAFLPGEFRKVKKIADKVLKEHKHLGDMKPTDAKYRFIKFARDLKTYGISVWKVREPMKTKKGGNKKKFQEVLLGVSRANVHRLDPVTKLDIEDSPYSLTKLKRWAPSKNSMTLDFGDHMDEYYTVLTCEGDAISALIEGYIDIILKQKKDRSRGYGDDDVHGALEDDDAQPRSATVSSFTKAGKKKKAGVDGGDAAPPSAPPVRKRPGVVKSKETAPAGAPAQQPEQKQPLTVERMTRELETVYVEMQNRPEVDEEEVAKTMDLDDEGLDDEEKEKKRLRNLQGARDLLSDVLGDLSLAAGDMYSAAAVSDAEGMEKEQLLQSARRIVQLANELDHVAAMNAIVSDNPDDIKAAKGELNEKVGKVMELAKLAAIDLDNGGTGDLDSLLAAAKAMGGAISGMLGASGVATNSAGAEDTTKKGDAVVNSAQKMAAATKDMKLADPSKQKELETAQKSVKDLADQLNATVVLSSASISDDKSKADVAKKQMALSSALDNMLTLADAGGMDPIDLASLMQCAKDLQGALGNLVGAVEEAEKKTDHTAEILDACKELAVAVDEVGVADTDPTLKAAVDQLTKAATTLGNLAQEDMEVETDAELKAHLEEASHAVASSIPPLQTALEAARSAKTADKPPLYAEVAVIATKLGETARSIMSERKQKAALIALANSAKKSANATLTLNDTLEESKDNRNPNAKLKAEKAAYAAAKPNEDLVEAARVYQARPSSVQYQKDLLKAVKVATNPSSKLVVASKACAGGFDLYSDQEAVAANAEEAGTALRDLLDALKAAQDACWALDCEAALDMCAAARTSIQAASKDVDEGNLQEPEYGVTQQSAMDELTDLTDGLGGQMRAMVAAMRNVGAEGFGLAAKDVAASVEMLAGATVQVAAFSKDKGAQQSNLAAMVQLAGAMEAMVKAARAGVDCPTDKAVQASLAECEEDVNDAVGKLLTTLPGQGDCLTARTEMLERAERLDAADLPPPEDGKGLNDYKEELQASSRALASAVSKLVTAASASPDELGSAARKVGGVMATVSDNASGAAATAGQQSAKHAIIGALKALSTAVGNTVEKARIVGADPDNLDAPKDLSQQANLVGPSIEEMLAALNAAAPGQSACDEASEAIEKAAGKLDTGALKPQEGVTFADSVAKLLGAVTALGNDTTALSDSARNQPDKVGDKATAAAKQVDLLADAASATAVLVPGAGNVKFNAHQFDALADKVLTGISAVVSAGSDPKQIVKAATMVAKAAQSLSEAAKTSSADLEDEAARKAMEGASASINNATSKLVSAAKKAAKDPNGANLDNLVSRSGSMQKKVMGLLTLASDVVGADPLSMKLQQDLLDAARAVAGAVSQMVGSSKVLANNPKDLAGQQLLKTADRQVADSLDKLVKAAKSAAPGQKECEQALDDINEAVNSLDSAIMAASVGELAAPAGVTTEKARKGVKTSMKKLSNQTKAIGTAAKSDAALLGSTAAEMGGGMDDFVKYVSQTAATMKDPDARADLLAAAQALASDLIPLVTAAKAAGGEGGNKDANAQLASAQKTAVGSIKSLLECMKNVEGEGSLGSGGDTKGCDAAAATIGEAAAVLDQPATVAPGLGYTYYQDEVLQRGKKLATTLAGLVQATKRNPENIGDAARDAADIFPKLCLAAVNAADFSSDPSSLLAAARAVADACRNLVGVAKEVEADPTNDALKKEVSAMSGNQVTKSIQALFAAAKAPATGQNETDDAIAAIDAATNELTTAELMANTRQLAAPAPGETYAKYQGDIVKQAKAAAAQLAKLIEAGSGTDAKDLATAAKNTAAVVSLMSGTVISGAIAMPEATTQVGLITAAKELCEALSETVVDTLAQSKAGPEDKAAKKKVKKDAKMAAEGIQRLISVANSALDDSTKGVVAVEQAAAVIAAAMAKLEEGKATGKATPEQAEAAARAVAKVATRLLLDAKKSQGAVAEASAETAQSVAALLELCINASAEASPEVRQGFLSSARSVAAINQEIMEILKAAGGTTKSDKAAHKKLMGTSKPLADSVADLVSNANLLSDPDGIDPDDPSMSAEREMLGAASEIDKASALLNKMRAPRGQGGPDEMSFEEQVLEACKAIMAAAQQLVKSSVVAQKDIVKTGRQTEGAKYCTDAKWASGLISAAQEVAGQCSQLVKHTDQVMKQKVDKPQLVLKAASKGVSSAVVHLVSAAQVKGDPNVKSQQRLKKAAKTVGEATKALVTTTDAATARAEDDARGDDDDEVELNDGEVGGAAQMMEARLKTLKLQAELEKARREMSALNRQKYSGKKKKAK